MLSILSNQFKFKPFFKKNIFYKKGLWLLIVSHFLIFNITYKALATDYVNSNSEKVTTAINSFINETCFIKPYNLYIDNLDDLLNLKIDNFNYELFKNCATEVYYKTRKYRINPIGPTADDKYEQREIILGVLEIIDNKLSNTVFTKELIDAHRSASDL